MAHRVLVADDLSAEGVQILRDAGLEVDVKVGLKPDELEAIIGGYDAVAVRSATKITARVLEKASRLKLVGRAGVGVDNVDLAAATRRGVVVMNTPGGSSVTVAELTVALMLSLSRHVAQATASIRGGKWEKKRFQGRELAGKTLGIVGIGNIGSVVVDRCRALRMRVVAYDPFISAEAASRMGVELVGLDDLWRQADVISLHVPLTDQTRNLVSAATLARMKKGALLVNCARGGLVDEKALADALASGHLGASTEEAQAAVATAIARQMALYLSRGVVQNAVNVPSLPAEALEKLGPYLSLAEKLGSLAGQIAPSGVHEVRVEFAGELAEVPQKPVTALVLKGLLQHFLDAPVNEVNAPGIARERSIAVREERIGEPHDYVSLLTVTVLGAGGRAVVAGTVFGKGDARIVRVNQFRIEAPPEGEIVLCENDDAPGVVGNIGGALGAAGVNIARISLSREPDRSSAFSLINVDQAPSPEVLEKLRALPHMRSVRHIRL